MTIPECLAQLHRRIEHACHQAGRDPRSVRLIGVSKGQPASAIAAAFEAGLTEFGENYWQEAREKQHALKHLPITWHFIGDIQSNKAKEIANQFDWVHTVWKQKTAQLLSSHRPIDKASLNVCIQVNLDNEDSKAGLAPEQVQAYAEWLQTLPALSLRGLMAIPKPQDEAHAQYDSLCRLTHLLNTLSMPSLDTLSMGMSDDCEAAIRAGATIIRVGRALFGERNTL